MVDCHIRARPIARKISPPPSKSQTMRAILFAALANGHSTIHHYLPSPDTDRMIDAVMSFGAKVTRYVDRLEIEGTHGKIAPTDRVIDAGNSGIVYRFCAALAALSSGRTKITGDFSIQTNRPITPLFDALKQLGAKIEDNTIQGPIHGGMAILDGTDSQPISALLIACSFLDDKTTLLVTNPGEKPWIDLTLSWAPCSHKNYEKYVITGKRKIKPFEYIVPADFSSALFPLAAGKITGQEIEVLGLDFSDLQGDKEVIPLLNDMPSSIDVNPFIDALPILAVVACFGEKPVHLYGGAIARKKESDRISAIAIELRKMGAKIEEHDDGLTIHPAKLQGTIVNAHGDHRIALSLICAGLGATGTTILKGSEACEKTYPTFFTEIAPPCLTLYGFKGVGKSTLGKELAEQLGWNHIDTDAFLGDSRALFKRIGEVAFRKIEREAILKIRVDHPTVISLGGGAILDEKIEHFCRSLGDLIYVDTPYATVVHRNPNLPPYFTESLYKMRKKKYDAIDHLTVEEAWDRIGLATSLL